MDKIQIYQYVMNALNISAKIFRIYKKLDEKIQLIIKTSDYRIYKFVDHPNIIRLPYLISEKWENFYSAGISGTLSLSYIQLG